jgi:hypothetical protein
MRSGVDPIEKQPGSTAAKFGGGLPDRGQWNSQQRGQIEIVESYDRHVSRHADIFALESMQDISSGYVVQGEQGGWSFRGTKLPDKLRRN